MLDGGYEYAQWHGFGFGGAGMAFICGGGGGMRTNAGCGGIRRR